MTKRTAALNIDVNEEQEPSVKRLGFINEGVYGSVYEGQYKRQRCAIKAFKGCESIYGLDASCIREIAALELLNSCDNSHTVRKLKVVPSTTANGATTFELVMEYYSHTLSSIIRGLTITQIRSLSRQLLIGVKNMHQCGLFHRDIKPENLLVNPSPTDASAWVLAVGDLGLSKRVALSGHLLTHEVVTMAYRAPELLAGWNHYTYSLDVWSVGIVILQLIAGRWPWPMVNTDMERLTQIFESFGYPEVLEEDGKLIKSMYYSDKAKHLAEAERSTLQKKLQVQKLPQAKILHNFLHKICSSVFSKRETKQVVSLLTKAFHYNHGKRASCAELLEMAWFRD